MYKAKTPQPHELNQASLDLPTEQLPAIEKRLTQAIEAVAFYRKEAVEQFRKTLMIEKMKQQHLSKWNINEKGALFIQNDPQTVARYNNDVRFKFKTSLNRLYQLQKSITICKEITGGSVNIPSDLLNLLFFFDLTNEEATGKIKRMIDMDIDDIVNPTTSKLDFL